MDIFLNELSFKSVSEIENSLKWLYQTLDKLDNQTIYSNIVAIKNWQAELDDLFDKPSRTYINRVFAKLNECVNSSLSCSYHYLLHQNLTECEDVTSTSLRTAADKILLNHNTAILNLPDSEYSKRPFLPILKSPYNPLLQDELANIPCFDNPQIIKLYVLLQEKIKPIIAEHKQNFDLFSAEYQKVISDFDFSNWQPKQLKSNGKLNAEFAFPASKSEDIKKLLSEWKIKNGSYEENKASYKKLGGIVAELHGYTKNDALSSHYKYDIYEGGYGNEKLFISLDNENGGFEMIDNSGTHIGVYSYNGSYLKHYTEQKDINSHSLKNISESMFLF